MAVQIQKYPGDTLYVNATVENGNSPETAISYFAINGPSHFSSAWSAQVAMEPNTSHVIPMSIPIPAAAASYLGVYDVIIYVWDYDLMREVVARTFPGEVEILALTAGVAWESILPYLIIAYWWDGTQWVQVLSDTALVEGGTYSINVSQACVLQYNGYYYELVEGVNEIVWQKSE